MEDFYHKCIAVCSAVIAKIIGVDFLVLTIWGVLVIIDIFTGVIKAKLTKDPIISQKMTDGFTRKLVPIALVFAFHLVVVAFERTYGIPVSFVPASFAFFYILAELKSIAENLQQAGILLPKGVSEKIDHIFNTNHKCKD